MVTEGGGMLGAKEIAQNDCCQGQEHVVHKTCESNSVTHALSSDRK